MFSKVATTLVVVNYLFAVALAIYTPIAPLQGSYTWEVIISDSTGPVGYTGGRTLYDYVSGYVRLESWNTADPNPGINGVTLWDLREKQPLVTVIDENTNCVTEKLDSNVTAPMPPDWSLFTFTAVKYFNRALAEQWSDGYGGVLYVDVFTRDVVGMGNTSTVDDGESIFYNIQSWSDKKPDGTEFLLPNTIPCKPANNLRGYKVSSVMPHGAMINFGCIACKLGVGLIIGRLCSGLGTAACAAFPPAIPFCAVLSSLACKLGVGKLSKEKACQIIRLC